MFLGRRIVILMLPLLLLLFLVVAPGNSQRVEEVSGNAGRRGVAGGGAASEKWDHNYSCIFDTSRSFTYLHIAYVTYFNISFKAPTYCSPQQCLDSCTSDCSCSAVVFDSPTTSCYQYHDYIPVQTIPFIPVRGRDTTTAYIKVQRGYDFNRASSLRLPLRGIWPGIAALLFTLLLLNRNQIRSI